MDAGVDAFSTMDTHEGVYHKGIIGGTEYLSRNALSLGTAMPRLTDDELANAVTLAKMAEYVKTGEDFYSLAEASQDRYLDLLIAEAAKTGGVMEATPQVWAAAMGDGEAERSRKSAMLSKL
jgi:hypothetical protein